MPKKNSHDDPEIKVTMWFVNLDAFKQLLPIIDDNGTCILGISPTNRSFQGENFYAMLLAIKNAGFKKLRIALADTLQRFNLQRQGISPTDAYSQSQAFGALWHREKTHQLGQHDTLYSHQEMIARVFPQDCGVEVTFECWDDIRCQPVATSTELSLPVDTASSSSSLPVTEPERAPEFAEIETIVQTAYHADPLPGSKVNLFASYVSKAAWKVIAANQHEPAVSHEKEFELAVSYILEELAMMALWGKRYPHSISPYPVSKDSDVMQLIQEAFKQLQKLTSLSDSLLHLDNFKMGTARAFASSRARHRSPPTSASSTHHSQAASVSRSPSPVKESHVTLSPSSTMIDSLPVPVASSIPLSTPNGNLYEGLSLSRSPSSEGEEDSSSSIGSLTLSYSSSSDSSPSGSPPSDSPITKLSQPPIQPNGTSVYLSSTKPSIVAPHCGSLYGGIRRDVYDQELDDALNTLSKSKPGLATRLLRHLIVAEAAQGRQEGQELQTETSFSNM